MTVSECFTAKGCFFVKILITGEKGYIANAVKNWFADRDPRVTVDLLSLRGDSWRDFDLSPYDTVIHTAALVHKNQKNFTMEDYRRINRDLTLEFARKARDQGVSQFVFFSTIAVYGYEESCFHATEITASTPLLPKSKYGISKYEAEQGLEALASPDFLVTILRPPFVYGRGCPGNYSSLRKLTLKFGIIPRLPNKKSMICIENLCQCVYEVCVRRLGGIVCPQNERIVSTYEMAQLICRAHGKKALCTPLINPFVKLASLGTRKLRVAFGNGFYSEALTDSQLDRAAYNVVDFETSVLNAEKP